MPMKNPSPAEDHPVANQGEYHHWIPAAVEDLSVPETLSQESQTMMIVDLVPTESSSAPRDSPHIAPSNVLYTDCKNSTDLDAIGNTERNDA